MRVNQAHTYKQLSIALVLVLVSSIVIRALTHQPDMSKECHQNIKKLSVALMIHVSDHNRLPEDLGDLVPNYLTALPNCPVAEEDTYTPGYLIRPLEEGELLDTGTFIEYEPGTPVFELCCRGEHHPRLGRDRPCRTGR